MQAYSFGDPVVKPFPCRIPLGLRGEVPDPSAIEMVALSGAVEMETECGFVALVNANGIDATPDGGHSS